VANIVWASTTQTAAAYKQSREQEIRAALCDLDKGDFDNAQKKIEAVITLNPDNIDAQKVLLGILTKRIKVGDKSDQNKIHIRTAIDAYTKALGNPKFTASEKAGIDDDTMILFGQLGEEEVTKELERRAADSKRSAKNRAEAYVSLAYRFWYCSFEITGNKKTLEKSDVKRANACVSKGLDYVERAVALDAASRNGWDRKAQLFRESAKLAGFENNQMQKASYERQAAEAQRRAEDLWEAARAAADKELSNRAEEDGGIPSDALGEDRKELIDYRAETSLSDAVKRVFNSANELITLVAPMPAKQESPSGNNKPETSSKIAEPTKGCFREIDGTAQVEEKREWKKVSLDGDFTAELPDNLCKSGEGFIAASEGVMYAIISMDRPKFPVSNEVVDGVLNMTAKTFVRFRSRIWLDSESGISNVFEIKLLRKEVLNQQPRKVYRYVLASCAKRKENVLISQATHSHYYTIDISGAPESDPRVERFVKSISFK
jgi:hypothetical protein